MFPVSFQASHELAQFRWVPFVARLLNGSAPRGGEGPELTVQPAHIHREAVNAIHEIVSRATWRYLARECGWRQRRVRLADDRSAVIRLWQQPTPPLRFTEASIHMVGAVKSECRSARIRERAHAEHPVDRSGAGKVFLSAWEELNFNQTAATLEEGRQRLRPVLT